MSNRAVATTSWRVAGFGRNPIADARGDVAKGHDVELIDFESGRGSRKLALTNRMSHGGVHVVRGSLSPNDGMVLGASQLTLAIHLGEPFDMEWRPPGSTSLRTTRIETGSVHINEADNPFYQRWTANPQLLVIALDRDVTDSIIGEIYGQTGARLRTDVGVIDPALANSIPVWLAEMLHGGPGARLLVESLANATVVHLFRNYSDGKVRPSLIKGGIGGRRLRRVQDYVEAHLESDLSVGELARLVDLSPHHFGQAFRETTGVSPYRYVVTRRIERAKLLLLTTSYSVTQVALAVGYSSHSHFCTNFQRVTGASPSRFRLDRL